LNELVQGRVLLKLIYTDFLS